MRPNQPARLLSSVGRLTMLAAPGQGGGSTLWIDMRVPLAGGRRRGTLDCMDLRDRYFEDFTIGHSASFGARAVTAEEIIAFARAFDPQPFHTSEEAGRATPYGGLIASGWHTASLSMRMLCDHAVSRHGLGSPGLDELRFHRPVRPGDTLSVRITVLESRRSQSKPDRGIVKQRVETLNQHGEVVLHWIGNMMVRCNGL